MRVLFWIKRTSSLEPRGMTRSMYLSRSRSEATTSRVVRSWIESLGTRVFVSALDIAVEIALKDNVVSFPPKNHQHCSLTLKQGEKPFKIAAFPDFIAREAMFAMTSGRASKIIRSTPIGQVTLSSSKPSSNRVRNVTLLTILYRVRRSHAPL